MTQSHPDQSFDKRALMPKTPGTRELCFAFFLFLAFSLVSLYFSSIHSPFYRYSYFQDANVYMSVAKAMKHGLMPYRDVFDHKGILLYLINYAATLLFPKSMTGIYLILSLSLTGFLFYGYRIARMFIPVGPSLLAAILPLLFRVGSESLFPFGLGPSEEYMLPCLMACLFYLIRLSQPSEEYPNNGTNRLFFDSLIVGLFSGMMLWIKYSTLPAIGVSFLLLYIFLFSQKRGKDVLRSLSGVCLGVLLISMPLLLFLGAKGIAGDMWSSYILFNSKYVGGKVPDGYSADNMSNLYRTLPQILLSVPGILYLRKKTTWITRTGAGCVLAYLIMNLLTVLISGRFYYYYFLAFMPFPVLATTAVLHWIREIFARQSRIGFSRTMSRALIAGSIVLILSVNIYSSKINLPNGSVLYPKTNMEHCAEAINEYWDQNGNGRPPRIISFTVMEAGLMQLCDTYPQNRYFYMPGVFGSEADAIIREQISYIEQGTVDFVFVYGNYSAASLVSQTNAEYEQIYIRENLRSGDGSHYYIYAKVDRIQEDGKG